MGSPTLFTIPVLGLHEDLWALARAIAMVDGGGALILVAADRAGITGAKAFAEARTTHQEFYCTGSRGGYRGDQAG
jgi:hypothetical protein